MDIPASWSWERCEENEDVSGVYVAENGRFDVGVGWPLTPDADEHTGLLLEDCGLVLLLVAPAGGDPVAMTVTVG